MRLLQRVLGRPVARRCVAGSPRAPPVVSCRGVLAWARSGSHLACAPRSAVRSRIRSMTRASSAPRLLQPRPPACRVSHPKKSWYKKQPQRQEPGAERETRAWEEEEERKPAHLVRSWRLRPKALHRPLPAPSLLRVLCRVTAGMLSGPCKARPLKQTVGHAGWDDRWCSISVGRIAHPSTGKRRTLHIRL
eukprot:2090965-Rhodomonas_salina.3